MRFTALAATAAVGALALAACGGTSNTASSTHQHAVPVTVISSSTVTSGDTSLGRVLVSASGHTLYALTKDTNGNSSCNGTCANVWPPVLAGKGWTTAPGLDRSQFGTTLRSDGTRQLVSGQWPLYTFSGDASPGDVNGQGSGGVWFAVGTNGRLIKNAPASPTTMAVSAGGY